MDRAIFLDRDGTLVDDPGYVHKVEDFKLLPGVVEGLKRLSEGFIFFIITNQSGIRRGIHTEDDMHNFNGKLEAELKKYDIKIKKIYFCPHAPEDLCECRKPNDKYVKEASKEFKLDLKRSWVIGDHPHDIEMGIRAGCKSIYLLTGHGKKHFDDLSQKKIKPNFIGKNFLEAAGFIIKNIK